ncbi:MAG: transglycosylase family protein [Parcubacteria group bacterium]|nr:transglycosylase family protein [Parcubacteria group bacterium]
MNTLLGLGLALSLVINQGVMPVVTATNVENDSKPIYHTEEVSESPVYKSINIPVAMAKQAKVQRIDSVIEKLIQCESGGKNVKIIDSNGYYSYGILQFQKATWDGWSRESGIVGDPMVPEDAIQMARWAIKNGFISHWTCARILDL